MPALLRVLFLGFAWLPIAFALYAAQSAWFAMSGEFVLGRAPAHALFIGFFGSLLVAMVTRVTQGHSGRPLVLGRWRRLRLRDRAAGRGDARASRNWSPMRSPGRRSPRVGWLLAFLPWVLRSGWIYLTPRADGQPARSMIEFYPQIKWVHVAAVIASGALFALRGAGVLAGAAWPMCAPLRYLSYTIDTVLLTAALMLATILHQYPVRARLAHGQGAAAGGLHRARQLRAEARPHAARRVPGASPQHCCVYLFIASVARAHHPLGIVRALTG